MAPKSPQIFITFLMHIDVLMLCSKFELIPTSICQVTGILRKRQNSEKIPVLYIDLAHGFFQKWLRNHPQFLLHFLMHIDVLMLCSKFELIPTSIFQVTAILRKRQNSEKIPVL